MPKQNTMADRRAGTVRELIRGCLKCCFGILSFVMLCSAVLAIAFGITIQVEYGGALNIFGGHFQLFAILLMCLGLIYFLLGIFGIGSLIRKSFSGLTAMAYFVVILAVMQILTGLVGIGAKGYVHGEINKRMKTAQNNYLKNPTSQIAWNITQNKMNCCGIQSPNEWFKILGDQNLPDSCCISKSPKCGLQAIIQNNFNNNSCLKCYVNSTNFFQVGISVFGVVSSLFHLLLIAMPLYIVKKFED